MKRKMSPRRQSFLVSVVTIFLIVLGGGAINVPEGVSEIISNSVI